MRTESATSSETLPRSHALSFSWTSWAWTRSSQTHTFNIAGSNIKRHKMLLTKWRPSSLRQSEHLNKPLQVWYRGLKPFQTEAWWMQPVLPARGRRSSRCRWPTLVRTRAQLYSSPSRCLKHGDNNFDESSMFLNYIKHLRKIANRVVEENKISTKHWIWFKRKSRCELIEAWRLLRKKFTLHQGTLTYLHF